MGLIKVSSIDPNAESGHGPFILRFVKSLLVQFTLHGQKLVSSIDPNAESGHDPSGQLSHDEGMFSPWYIA